MGPYFSDEGSITTQQYDCGYCGRHVGADKGWSGEDHSESQSQYAHPVYLALCPNCGNPTYIDARKRQVPASRAGDDVSQLPTDVDGLYREARDSFSHGSYTAAVLVGRKLLMHVAVEKGADDDKNFAYYVNWLADQGVVTADMKEWVDEIRQLGNDANHEIVLMAEDEADALLTFVAVLLKIVYEYPQRGRRSVAARKVRQAGVAPGEDEVQPATITFEGGAGGAPPVLGP